MTYSVTGRATRIEERGLKNADLIASGLPPLPSMFKRTPTQLRKILEAVPRPPFAVGPNANENGLVPIDSFTREYQMPVETPPRFERPKPAVRNFFHECPVLDMANKGTLIIGEDETETFIQNGLAATLLCLVRDCVDTVSTVYYGAPGAGEMNAKLHGMDCVHDNGPSVMGTTPRFKKLWESGAEKPAELGQPWAMGSPAILVEKTKHNAPALRQVGQIEFKKAGHVSPLSASGKSISYETRVRAPKGKKQVDASEFLAGQTAPNHRKIDEMSDTVSTNRAPMGDDHPVAVWERFEREREGANAKLDKLADRLTPKLYNALIEAATGATLDEIGRSYMPGRARSDKRPGTAGKVLVVTALDILLRDEALKSDLNLTLNLAVTA